VAVDVNSFTDNGIPNMWEPADGSLAPWGEMVYVGSNVIPVIGVGDQAVTSLQLNLPRNFLWKLTYASITMLGPDGTFFDNWNGSFLALFSTDKGGISSVFSALETMKGEDYLDDAATGIRTSYGFTHSTIATNDRARSSRFEKLPNYILDCSDAGRVLIRNNCPTASIAAGQLNHHFRFTGYTVVQGKQSPIHTIVLNQGS